MTFESYESRLDAALRTFIHTNLIGVLFTDLAGQIISADQSFLNLVGYTGDDLPPNLRDLISPEHHRLDEEAFEKLMA
ncbi:MAG TPA: PAS domain-containing protein, partial [Pyrinomonadaceae bacterium]|nr:PAS domain-containing protein [Pyrinomonadaceae bacterium]